MTWVLDLDGVLWLSADPIPGAADAVGRLRAAGPGVGVCPPPPPPGGGHAVARLRAAGQRVVFCTNNSAPRLGEHEAKLAAIGIPAEGDVLTSAMAAARLVAAGERVLVCGGPGIVEAVEAQGAVAVRDGDAEAVAVGFHREFDYERLRVAARAVDRGARLIATNDDATYPTPDGPIPGGGALVAAVAYATGVEPIVAGKPHLPMADLVRAVGGTDGTVVGDRPSTDGALARQLGYRFALVLTGVTREEDLPVSPEPDVVAPSLAALVQ